MNRPTLLPLLVISIAIASAYCTLSSSTEHEQNARPQQTAKTQQHPHLSFKGIPIEGSMTSFCQNLASKGFKSTGTQNNVEVYTGDFTGQQVNVGVIPTNNGQDVYGVSVLFPASREWNTLTGTYSHYKDLYTQKYGDPSTCTETNPAYSESNTIQMLEVFEGRAVYTSTWDAPGGTIELSIEKSNGFREGMVIIRYRDQQNAEAKLKQDLDEI